MAVSEQQLDQAIAILRNETKLGGNTRARVASLFKLFKNWTKGSAGKFQGVYEDGPIVLGSFYLHDNAIWEALGNFDSATAPVEGPLWTKVLDVPEPIFDAFVTSQAQGDIPNGTQMQGKTLLEALKLMLSRPFAPLGVTLNINNTLHEQGSTPTITVSSSIAINDETGGINYRRIYRNGVEWVSFNTNSFSQNDTPTNTLEYEALVEGVKSGVRSAKRTVDFDIYHFYGPAASVPTATTARNLVGKQFKSQGNTFTLNTGTVQKNFYILLAPGENLVSVVDQDALNLNITSEYVLLDGNFSVNDAAGVAVSDYRLYEKTQGVPYGTSHRHNITIS